MDWSGIEELWLERITGEILEKLPNRLTSLHTLESTNLKFIEALPNNTLKNFTWIGSSKFHDLPAILSRQGQSLQSLEFRCPEIRCPSFFPEFDISILPNATKNLTHLSINLPRNGTWPLESLTTIASLPNLRTVDLYLNIQSPCRLQMPDEYSYREYQEFQREFGEDYCKGEDQFQKPFLDGSEALTLAEHMKEKNEGEKLEQVTFWVGDWTRSWDGPLYSPAWVEGRSAKIVCKIGSRDVEQRICTVEHGERYWTRKDAWGWETSDWD